MAARIVQPAWLLSPQNAPLLSLSPGRDPIHLRPRRSQSRVYVRAGGVNLASTALAWFNNVRVPAALLATAAMRMLFVGEGKGKGRVSGALRAFYVTAMGVTV
eukprot:6419179-Amphidinium_carterae.1